MSYKLSPMTLSEEIGAVLRRYYNNESALDEILATISQPIKGELLLDLMSTMNVVVGNAISHRDDPKSGVDYGDFTGVAKNLVRIFKGHGWVKLPNKGQQVKLDIWSFKPMISASDFGKPGEEGTLYFVPSPKGKKP